MITIDRAEVACSPSGPPQVRANNQPSARSSLLRVLRIRNCTVGQLRALLGDGVLAAVEEAGARGEVEVRTVEAGGGWQVPLLYLTVSGLAAAYRSSGSREEAPAWLVRAERADKMGQVRLL